MRQAVVVTLLLGVLAFAAIYIADTPARNARWADERHGSALQVARKDYAPSSGVRGASSVGAAIGAGIADAVGSGLRAVAEAGRAALQSESRSFVQAARRDFVLKAAGVDVINAPVDQDYGAAVARYALAANPDDPDANYSLGLIYRDGKGTPVDAYAALRHLLAAAQHGNAQAQVAVAELYEDGRGTRQNRVAAYVWYDCASKSLQTERGRMAAAIKRDRQVAAMGPAERTAAKDLAERQVPRLVGVAGDD
ncbi:MAG: sel1 repeat family protein [Bauldia sp.]|nr:sel1 repeat family protein [Bauldia sp.]